MKLHKILATDRDGKVVEVSATVGESVMYNMREHAGMDIAALCGGCCSCATCHVYVDDAWQDRVGAAADSERDLVESSKYYRPGASRLGCQITFTAELDGLRVTLAPEDL